MRYDLIIIGGGINGCAIAREAALNGRSVLLVEKDDIAAHTSSASTGLIHGGLRYLEYYEFRLVREALQERERLLKLAPHLVRPIRLILPHVKGLRPWWLVRLGLWIYDHLGGRISLPASRGLRAEDVAYRAPLAEAGTGFVYSDARVDDARFTLAFAIDAAAHGAEVRTRMAFVAAARQDGGWAVTLSDGSTVHGAALVNAAGPWVMDIANSLADTPKAAIRLVKGSHIVVPRLFEGAHGYMLQQSDRRIIFALPWQGATEIGTTEIIVEAAEAGPISGEEVDYLCAAANAAFGTALSAGNVLASWSGVRPLYDDGAAESRAVTRDYVLELETEGAPLLSVFGGKITTARRLAEQAFDKLAGAAGWRRLADSGAMPLPGGDMADFPSFLSDVRRRWPFLGEARSERMASAYGTRLGEMLDGIVDEAGLGRHFGVGLTEVEARWMRTREWAMTAEDALHRRSRLSFHMRTEEIDAFTRWWNGEGTSSRESRRSRRPGPENGGPCRR